MPKTIIPEHAVTFKGIEQGVLILIDTSHDYEKIIKTAVQKIKANKKFLSENTLFIQGAAGPLDPDELGMARKIIRDKTKMEVLPLPRKSEGGEQQPILLKKPIEALPPLVASNALRAGQELHSDGDIILFGNTHPGSRIFAKGSVYVFGLIRGEVYAGETHNPHAIVACRGFAPVRLSIGGIIMQTPSDALMLHQYVYAKVNDQQIEVIPYDEFTNE